jgi:hypothetical protein
MNVLDRDAEDLPSLSLKPAAVTTVEKAGVMKFSPGRDRRVVGNAIGPRAEPGLDSTSISVCSSHSQEAAAAAPARALPPKASTGINSVPTGLFPVTKTDTLSDDKKAPKSWLARLSWGGDEVDDIHTTDYECLEPPEQSAQTKRKGIRILPSVLDAPTAAAVGTDSNNTASFNATVEDRLKQDCSFFYREMQTAGDNIMGRNRDRKMRVNTADQQQRRRMLPTSSLAAMSRQRVMSSRDGALFMNRYEQLNQDMHFGDSDDESEDEHNYRNHRNDLLLDEEVEFGSSPTSSYHEHNPGPTNNVVTDGLRTSSLFYEQNGRVLMKLPRDQVRLIMDPDLGPGILSVEQWRTREDVEREYAAVQEQLETGRKGIDPLMLKGGGQQPADELQSQEATKVVGVLSNLHELHYVMTVPDDLYQRVVSEISTDAFPPYWGFFKCCNQDRERADIKLAVAILAFVMFILFIGSIEWPTN